MKPSRVLPADRGAFLVATVELVSIMKGALGSCSSADHA